MAIATDCQPRLLALTSILLTINMACTLFRLTPEEALAGVTRNAARALGRDSDIGTIGLASGAISRSGTSNVPPSLPTASASIPSIPASGEASDEPALLSSGGTRR